jgi:arginine/lysine/ornithine decarboxylase
MPTRTGSPIYNSMWQLRRDVWSSMEEVASRFTECGTDTPEGAALIEQLRDQLATLEPMEHYWGFPGRQRFQQLQRLLAVGDTAAFARMAGDLNRALVTDSYRQDTPGEGSVPSIDGAARRPSGVAKPYFEVLVVGEMTPTQEQLLRDELHRLRRPDDEFRYEVVVVPSFTDAVTAVLFNYSLQSCIIRQRFGHRSQHDLSAIGLVLDEERIVEDADEPTGHQRAQSLARRLHELRPELDLFLMAERAVEELAGQLGRDFRRVFHAKEGALELHLSVLRGVAHRYNAPFFAALRRYSHQPTGVFHALPVSRGKSVVDSRWIGEMVDFYGLDVFLAETSATCGGLDSLLEPTGPLREAQQLAAETFGSRETFWVTNGTSTANKIVVQALQSPGDIVLVDRNCHQSHHYGLVMSGAQVIYLDAYRLNEYSMYGAVPLREIKRTLLDLRRAGKLDRVRMVMLTNCTFDGVVYDVERVMEECLAIKPDLIFLWDEAWFAFARFHPVYRSRTAMASAAALLERLRDPDYHKQYVEYSQALGADPDDDTLLANRLYPDPERARVRVYATQSTHKTLTSLRQGSMIHVFDQDYDHKAEETFHEAYMAHNSTSPNYQILASLDLGRRQVALEGLELVQKQVECAMRLRDAIDNHPLLSRYVRCLTTADLIPRQYRPAGIDQPLRSGLQKMLAAWHEDEFVLDPCRITLSIGPTGIDGDTFKRAYLMDRYGVQVNKTSRNTVLFMTHIGTTRSSVAYLIEVLVEIVRRLDDEVADLGPRAAAAHEADVHRLTVPGAPLPNFSEFHEAFRESGPAASTPEGDIRKAFYAAYDDAVCTYLSPDEVAERLAAGEPVVSATFVTPYPPGYPVLVPGQCFSTEIMEYMAGLDTPEVHGYRPELGYRVFAAEALGDRAAPEAAGASERGRRPRRRLADPGPTGEEKPADQPLTAAGETPAGS